MKTGHRPYLKLILTLILSLVCTLGHSRDIGPADLTGEDKEMFDKFRYLFQNGTPEEFYSFAQEYEADLKEKGYMMLYYKLKNNEGFFALRHNMILRAMRAAKELDSEMRNDGASRFYYLATGLMGDVYYVCHDRAKAEKYFTQALEEVTDDDPKFQMRTYQSLAEMLSLKDAKRALEWADKAIELAHKTDNTEYLSLSLGMKAYIYFLEGNSVEFFHAYDQYLDLKSQSLPNFSYRYDNVVEIARMAFNGDFYSAGNKLREGHLNIDSSLVAVCLYTMEGNTEKNFGAIKRRFLEMDSTHSLMQSANFDQMASERALMRSKEETRAAAKVAKWLVIWIVILTILFIILYTCERKRLKKKIFAKSKALEKALDRAEESDRMKSAFIRNMSHEIRTPLNAISGFSQLLCTPDYQISDEDKADMMERITDNVNVITTIVNELLDLSQVEINREKETVMLNDVCRDVVACSENKNTKRLDLRFETTVDDEFTISSHTESIRRILLHLFDNALKFTNQGSITLRCEQKGKDIALSVTDTGIGIAPADRQKVFDNFVKLSEYTGGVGLGLPICRQIVKQLGGSINIDEDYNSGSRFIVLIPV